MTNDLRNHCQTCPYCNGEGIIPTQRLFRYVGETLKGAGIVLRSLSSKVGADPNTFSRGVPKNLSAPGWVRLWQVMALTWSEEVVGKCTDEKMG